MAWEGGGAHHGGGAIHGSGMERHRMVGLVEGALDAVAISLPLPPFHVWVDDSPVGAWFRGMYVYLIDLACIGAGTAGTERADYACCYVKSALGHR